MMEVQVTWAMVSGLGGIVFVAGMLVERVRNGKYVRKDLCEKIHDIEAIRLEAMDENIQRLMTHFKLTPRVVINNNHKNQSIK